MTGKKKNYSNFETALKRLEEITEQLEAGDVKLDDSIALYSEGVEAVEFCRKKLAEAEKKILMVKEKNKELIEIDFGHEENDDQ